jgi:3-carboxy-cis,cis-muconate cycloisomerase
MRLIESLATTEPLAEIFADGSVLQAMLDFEAALALAEAEKKIIPRDAARLIAQSAQASHFDPAALASAAARSATPAIPLVKALTEFVRSKDPAAANFVHWGATSQDVCDTALVLLLRRARPLIESDLHRLQQALLRLAKRHRRTVMLARTLLQPAPPITFGMKAAGWLAAIRRSHKRVEHAFDEALILQFGGASGTLAALGRHGISVGRAIAGRLKLTHPDAPWHAHRDRLASLLCACAVLAGALGKMARDITLLMQAEVAEVSEARSPEGGGSSTMPHKHNPAGCVVTSAAAARIPALVSSFLAGMVQEHERAAGAWQAEWPVVSEVVQATGLAVASMAAVAERLIVDPARMRANIDATGGAIFTERAMIMLGQKLGRDVAHEILQKATLLSKEKKQSLREALLEMEEMKGNLDREALNDLEVPEQYLGVAEEFQERLLDATTTKFRPRRHGVAKPQTNANSHHGDAEARRRATPKVKIKTSPQSAQRKTRGRRGTPRITKAKESQ